MEVSRTRASMSMLELQEIIHVCENGYKIEELREFLSGIEYSEGVSNRANALVDFVVENHGVEKSEGLGFFYIESSIVSYIDEMDTIDHIIDMHTKGGFEDSNLLIISNNRFLIPEVEKYVIKNKHRCTFTSMYDLLKEANCVSLWGDYHRYSYFTEYCNVRILIQDCLTYLPDTNSFVPKGSNIVLPSIEFKGLSTNRKSREFSSVVK